MKILIFTDNHYSQYSSIVRSRGEKYSTRLHNQIKSLNWITELAEEQNCQAIVCNGDFFDKPELNAEELTALQDIKWSKTIPYYFIVGNHEMGLNDLSISSTHLFQMIPNAKIIDKPYYEAGFGYRLIYLPYILESNRKDLINYINEAIGDSWETQEVKKTIILSHNDISGIRYGQYMSQIGFNIKEIEDHCDLYINGHLHNQQQISKKILNLGNLTGQNFSEDADKHSHCAAVLDTDTLSLDLIDNPYALNFYKFDIFDKADFKKLDNCLNNSVLSIRTRLSLLEELKVLVNYNDKIISHRFIVTPELNNQDTVNDTVNDLVKMDHIEQFKNYIMENLENNDILKEELSNIN
jgi:DNA repair exonuclease SbcCD nuclease subunit